MIVTIYAALGRLAYKTVSPLLKFYMNDKHVRARVLVLNDQQEILLVRSWMGHQQWSLPGGGLSSGETPQQAATRELEEETGIKLPPNQLHSLGTFANPHKNSPYTVACFTTKIAKQDPQIAGRRKLEVLDVAWFKLKQLPKMHSPVVDKALELLY